MNQANPQPTLFDPHEAALSYLREQLGPRAPATVTLLSEFNESPLEGEGRTWLFSFALETGAVAATSSCPPADRAHMVAVGETKPNYFPTFGFSADDAYSFHIGTRFMLEMGVQKIADDLEPPDACALLTKMLAGVAPDAKCSDLALAGLFRCEEEYFAVYRLSIDGVPHYAMGADCPPGFYQLTGHPPQTALRLHLGKLIRAEGASSQSAG